MSLEKVLERLAHLTGAGSDAELARTLDVSRQSLSKWRSRGSIPYEKLQDFAEEHGHSLDYLLMGKEPEKAVPEISEEVFHQVWGALRADNCQLSQLKGDLLLEQAILIYNQVIQVTDPVARARTIDGSIRLLNSLSFKRQAEAARYMAENHPDLIDVKKSEQFAEEMDKRAKEDADSGTKTSQTFHGNVGQVGGGDIHNDFGKDK